MNKPTTAHAIEMLKAARDEIVEKKADMPIKALDSINWVIEIYDMAIETMEMFEKSVDAGYLHDWYTISGLNDEPLWTDAHFEELCNDFILIPKPIEDVQGGFKGLWEK